MNNSILLKISPNHSGEKLTECLVKLGYPVNADCGGKGICGKCAVKVISGQFFKNKELTEILTPSSEGYIRSCSAFCGNKPSEVLVDISDGSRLEIFTDTDTENKKIQTNKISTFNAALDIGTTTLAFALTDSNGNILETTSCLNPQRAFGADVMSRINAAAEGQLKLMQSVLLNVCKITINKMLASALNGNEIAELSNLVISGNTTMLHIFCNVSPAGMGTYPFTPEFIDKKKFPGETFDLPFKNIILLPSVSAFIGSDITSGAYAINLTAQQKPSVLLDIGTNGEMMLFTGTDNGSKLYAASAAAGPAMEGADISTGVGGVPGAVCSVKTDNKKIIYDTIDKKPPVGICGSGLIDLIAELLENDILDTSGYLECEVFPYAKNPPIELTIDQNDIRAFQLAKSAIRAAFEALTDYSDISIDMIENVYLAGGLGYYMNKKNAIRVGLIPDIPLHKIRCIGNSSLGGAVKYIRNIIEKKSNEAEKIISDISKKCETVDLNFSEVFNEEFIKQMSFPDK